MDGIIRRRGMGLEAETKPPLPSGYTAYDYILNSRKGGTGQANNGIMINTGLSGSEYGKMKYSHEMVFSATSITDTATTALWGIRAGTGTANVPNSRVVFLSKNNTYPPAVISGQQNNGTYAAGSARVITEGVIYSVKTVGSKVYLNGVLTDDSVGDGSFTPADKAIYLLGENRDQRQAIRAYVRLRSFIVRDTENNDELIAAMYPCIRDSDGVSGMYDVVRNSFHTATTASYCTCGND